MKKNVMWNTIGSIFYCFCQWLITIIVVHLSSYEDAGYLSLAMTTSSSFSAIALFSMRNFQVSDIEEEYSSSVYVGSRILTSMAAFVCCALTAFWKGSLYQILCIDAFMLIRVGEAMVDVLHGIDQKYQRFDYIGKSYILRGIITVVFFTIGIVRWKSLPVSLFVMAGLNFLVVLWYDWRKTKDLEQFSPVFFKHKVWELLKRCLPLVIFSFLLSYENLLPKMILKQQSGAEELGVYSSIASPTLVVQVFASVVFNPFLPAFSAAFLQKDMKRLGKMLHKTYFLLIVMSMVVTIGALICGRMGLRLLFGMEILEHYYLFLPIVWCTILTAAVWVISAILVAFRKISWLVAGMLVDFAICVLLVKPVIEQYGKNGVSIVQIIVLAIYIIYMGVVCEMTIFHETREGRKRRKMF